MTRDYNTTLNLPKTEFPMRGNLPTREPELFERFDKERLYYNVIEKNKGKPLYILHDGPPYANGEIHLGTALNKVLKDFIIKQKNMSGFKAPFVPGFDTHGLPIELKALKAAGADKNNISDVDLRNMCKDFAIGHVEQQKKQFKSLGVVGDYENPYLTLNKEFEARQIEVFGKMAEKDFIYRGLKPVYWCAECGTALAEAEIEYSEDKCYSIYVKFQVNDDKGFFAKYGIDKSRVYFVIWTTTTWTLPSNVAICLGPKYEYTVVKNGEEYYVIAKDLVEETMSAASIENYETIGSFKGKDLEYISVKHPFLDRESVVINGDHVTLESGTGCVHTAPGHGIEDFEVCQKYSDIPIVVAVDNNGKLTDEAGEFAGLTTEESNKAIVQKMDKTGNLLAVKKISHSYPHCWRCKQPILFRATEQWFCSIDGFKKAALEEVKNVNWIPSWGQGRIENMIKDRSDWCISRQRVWGVPIPILYCKKCRKHIINKESVKYIADMFRQYGSDAWFTKEPHEFLPEDFSCPDCGGHDFYKEKDVMDVWFDSGCSHTSVLESYSELRWPADLYLEGADQYRGWFQSSLLTAVATKGKAPYKAVCTHGWVVDGEGRKMSKSLSNGVAPEKIVEKYGADILRLWVASSDYHADIRISPEILKQLTEVYRKIRNTARFILGNISDFDPDKDAVSFDSLHEVDRWALSKLNDLLENAKNYYDNFEFYGLYHSIHNFCVVDMSNFYLDIIKDRLYCELKDGVKRRAAQTAMFIILDAFTRLIAPILSFTSEEIWSAMPHRKSDDVKSVFYNDMYFSVDVNCDEGFYEKWNEIHSIRNVVKKALEEKRAMKVIGSSLDAKVILYCDDNNYDFVNGVSNQLSTAFLVSMVEVKRNGEGEYKFDSLGISVDVEKSRGNKCERCWTYSESVGEDHKHPTLCDRCAEVIKNI